MCIIDESTEVIPKFNLLLQRGSKLPLHGNGANTRRYLYGGDAADAFDTILHHGEIGHVYNVDSRDEVSTLDLCATLLRHFGHAVDTTEQLYKHVEHVQDRPFNDHRYAVNGNKLRQLGWEQRTGFEEGLRATVDWYRRFGAKWWGNVDSRLAPFPLAPITPPMSEDGVGSGKAAEAEIEDAVDGMAASVE